MAPSSLFVPATRTGEGRAVLDCTQRSLLAISAHLLCLITQEFLLVLGPRLKAGCLVFRDAEEEPSLLVLPLLKATTNTTQPAAALLAFSPILQEGAGASLQTSSLASCSQCVSRNNQRRRVGMPEQSSGNVFE